MTNHSKVSKDMTIGDVLRKNPKLAEIFMRHGMHCLGCPTASGESIEQAALAHGIKLNVLMKDLNGE